MPDGAILTEKAALASGFASFAAELVTLYEITGAEGESAIGAAGDEVGGHGRGPGSRRTTSRSQCGPLTSNTAS